MIREHNFEDVQMVAPTCNSATLAVEVMPNHSFNEQLEATHLGFHKAAPMMMMQSVYLPSFTCRAGLCNKVHPPK
jgi:hypothetical protein